MNEKKIVKTIPLNLNDLKGMKVEYGNPVIETETDATITNCEPIQNEEEVTDDKKEKYINCGFRVTYSLKLDGEVREIIESLTGLRKYKDHLWSSKDSGFGMLNETLKKQEEYGDDPTRIPALLVGAKMTVITRVIHAFGVDYNKIVPVKIEKLSDK